MLIKSTLATTCPFFTETTRDMGISRCPLAGHLGTEETIRSIKQLFYWPDMNREIRRYVSKFHLCLCTKPVRQQITVGQRPRKPRSAWETVALDLMGPYPLSTRGNRFIFVITDLFFRCTEAFSFRNSNASTIIKILEEEVFSRFGYPNRILSDNTTHEAAFKAGDLVFAKNTRLSNGAEHYNAKMAPRRTGPYSVLKVVSSGVLWIQKEGGPHKVYVMKLILVPTLTRLNTPYEVANVVTQQSLQTSSDLILERTTPIEMIPETDERSDNSEELIDFESLQSHTIACFKATNYRSKEKDREGPHLLQTKVSLPPTIPGIGMIQEEDGNRHCGTSNEVVNTPLQTGQIQGGPPALNNNVSDEALGRSSNKTITHSSEIPINDAPKDPQEESQDGPERHYALRRRTTVNYRDARRYEPRERPSLKLIESCNKLIG